MQDKDEILVVHLGGLGDVCLSESVFLSLRECFGDCLVALGNRRFLDLFGQYFKRTQGVESRHWLYLFSERLTGPVWKRIVFIGKDRQGRLRRRWRSFSKDELVFIEMYPDGAFGEDREKTGCPPGAEGRPHIEAYQLAQLSGFGIMPLDRTVAAGRGERTILYPEEGLSKDKWPVENFVALYHRLGGAATNTVLLKPPGLEITVEGALFLEDLPDVKSFFAGGGIFVSNDSGMAHLAGACGLFTVTVFTDFDPAFWHPRGNNVSLKAGKDRLDVESLAGLIDSLSSGEITG